MGREICDGNSSSGDHRMKILVTGAIRVTKTDEKL